MAQVHPGVWSLFIPQVPRGIQVSSEQMSPGVSCKHALSLTCKWFWSLDVSVRYFPVSKSIECELETFHAVTATQTEMSVLPMLMTANSDAYNYKLLIFVHPILWISHHYLLFFFPNSCAEKCCLQFPNPAQSGPWETALHVWVEYPQAAKEEFVQPNLWCVTFSPAVVLM